MVKRMSHHSLVNNQFGVKRKNSQLGAPVIDNFQDEEHPKASFKVHTNRGGHIQINRAALNTYEYGHQFTDYSDDQYKNEFKKPKKTKLLKMIITILRHFFGSMYFVFVILSLYLAWKGR